MSLRLLFTWLGAALLLPGCVALRITWPPGLSADDALVVDNAEDAPKHDVDIDYDTLGVPHIYAQSEADAAYGLGFAHARDRLFQIDLLRLAAQGRLTELFGRPLLDVDRQLRLLTWRLDEQVAALSRRDRELIDAYVRGVNAGALHAGRSLEMHVLGRSFIPLTARDVVAIMRMRAWNHSKNLFAELAHARVIARLPPGSEVRAALLAPVGGHDVAMVPPPPAEKNAPASVAARQATPPRAASAPPPAIELAKRLPAVFDSGASGAWVVAGAHTQSGAPILVGDPHLRHTQPSVFYLAHLNIAGRDVAGATYPGIPAILMGFTKDFAWTLTTSFADTQDLVALRSDPDRPNTYFTDDNPPVARPFKVWTERYIAGGEVAHTETWLATEYGPVLPAGYDYLVEPGDTYALLWAGFFPEQNRRNLSAYWDLAGVKTPAQLNAAAAKLGTPSQNLLGAFRSGDISWRLLGALPLRASAASTERPRTVQDGPVSWRGFAPVTDRPRSDNPTRGYLFNENQRLIGGDSSRWRAVGRSGALPWRARRLKERLDALLAKPKKVNAATLLALQQDVHSVEARELAPILGRHCPHDLSGFTSDQRRAFCSALLGFDAQYKANSRGALVFTLVLDAFLDEVLSAHLGSDVARQLSRDPATRYAIERALLHADDTAPSPLFDDPATLGREGIAGFMRRASDVALGTLVDDVSADPARWRWGALHRLQVRGPLAQTALVGSLYLGQGTEESGHSETLRAESGLPVHSGAALRYLVEMSASPSARLVLDGGQSGHKRHPHERDQFAPWQAGHPPPLLIERDAIDVAGKLRLLGLTAARGRRQ